MGNTSVRAPDALINAAKKRGINLSEVFRLALEATLEDKTSEREAIIQRIKSTELEHNKSGAELELLKLKLTKMDEAIEKEHTEEQRQAWLSSNMDALQAYRDGTTGPKGWEKLEAGLGISGIKKISEYLDKQKT